MSRVHIVSSTVEGEKIRCCVKNVLLCTKIQFLRCHEERHAKFEGLHPVVFHLRRGLSAH